MSDLAAQRRFGDRVARRVQEARTGLLPRLFAGDATLFTTDDGSPREVADRLGWLDLPRVMAGRLASIMAFAEEIEAEGFRHVVCTVGSREDSSAALDLCWDAQAREDVKQDRVVLAYDGIKPDSMVCDTTVRELVDGSWMLLILAGDNREPSPKNCRLVAVGKLRADALPGPQAGAPRHLHRTDDPARRGSPGDAECEDEADDDARDLLHEITPLDSL